MSLRIIKASEPLTVERINLCIYSAPGLGKTTMAFSAEAPLLLDFDRGAYRAANRKDIVPVALWEEVVSLTREDLADYKTIVVDTAGRALDRLTEDIIRENPKSGRGGALTLQGYGTLKAKFSAWLKMLNGFGKDVVLIAHMDEQRNGEDVIERLDVQGGSKGEIYKSVDAMGRIFVRDKKRVIDFSPRENSFGKNPANLEVIAIPAPAANNHFLADVVSTIKAKLNQASAEQLEAMRVTEEWQTAITDFSTVEDFNQHLKDIKAAPKAAQLVFAEKAKGLGFLFDPKAKVYGVPEHAHS